MEAADVLIPLARVGMLVFVVAGMLGTGLALSTTQVTRPLRDARLVVALLAVNFVVVPAVGLLLTTVLPVDEPTRTTLLLLAAAAGAPFLAPLARLARGDAGLAVGAMVLLMVTTVVYVPVVVPLLVPDAAVSPSEIAGSLVVLMIVPLAGGLLVHARHPEPATRWSATTQQVSTVGLALGLGAGLLAGWRDLLGVAGSWTLVGVALLMAGAYVAAHLAAVGRPRVDRSLLGLAGAQRNVAAALVVAGSLGDDVLVRTLAAAVAMPVALLLLAAEIGRRSSGRPGPGPTS